MAETFAGVELQRQRKNQQRRGYEARRLEAIQQGLNVKQ
jgi:hypothetical protein